MVFPEKKMKAFTLSYDDGVEQDRRFVGLLNKYNLKCTFNLNSGIQSNANTIDIRGLTVRRMNIAGLKDLYHGHEIAVHSLTHPFFPNQSIETIQNEIIQDKINLAHMFDQRIVGMAYPYGVYNESVIQVLKDNGICYARTVQETGDFQVQSNLYELKATCHHNNKNLMELAKQFIRMKSSEPSLFYVWGHSYEFDVDNTWDMIEEFFAVISNRSDICYGTNSEVLLCT